MTSSPGEPENSSPARQSEISPSEQRFLAMLQAVPSLTYEVDAEGNTTFVSDQWYAYTGLTPEETVGWGWTRVLPAEEVEAVKLHWAEVRRTGQPFETKRRLRARDGSYRWFLFRAVPIHDPDGRIVRWAGSMTDIEDLVRTENALRASEEFSHRLLASSHDCIKVLDMDGNLLSVAEGGRRLMEIEDVQPYLNRPYLSFWNKKDWPMVNEALEAAKAGGVGQFEGYSPSVTGTPRWWDARVTPIRGADGRPERLLVIARDVTEAKQSREALLRSEHRYRRLISILPVAIYTCDAEGRLEIYNQQAAALWGREPKIGEEFWCGSMRVYRADGEVLPPEECPMAIGLREGRRITGLEVIIERPDGSRANVMPCVEPFQDASGRPAGAVNVLMDITEQKRGEHDRQRLLEAERAARMESEKLVRLKDEFLSTVSHELRTPLGAIVGWTKLLAQGRADIGRAIEVISQSAASLTEIVDDLLNMSRIMSGKVSLKRERVSVVEIIGKAVENVQFAAEARSIRIKVRSEPGLDTIECDPTRLQQIVWNLLTNAIKFTPEGGKVSVTARGFHRYVQIQVRDTGEGIAPEFLPHLFERFRQQEGGSTRKHAGLGIGLAVVKQLVEMHGGTIEAHSDGEGQGATFTVRLPRLTAQVEHRPSRRRRGPAAQPAILGEQALKGLRILTIDDDPFSRELIDRILTDAGASVMTVDSARDALDVLSEYRPDLVVSDIGMPGDDGYRFVQQLRETGDWRAGLPCIALTAFARPEDRARAMAVGFDEHLGKPFDPNRLCLAVARLAGKRASPKREASRASPPAFPAGNTPHVLLAEDSPHVSELIKQALEQHGYRVSAAESIAEALAIARQSPIDILLSDLRLKDGMGWDLLTQLRADRPVPGIVMSGYADKTYVSRSQSAGFAEYMVKPVDLDKLVDAVRRLAETPVETA